MLDLEKPPFTLVAFSLNEFPLNELKEIKVKKWKRRNVGCF